MLHEEVGDGSNTAELYSGTAQSTKKILLVT